MKWFSYGFETVCGECAQSAQFTDADRDEMEEAHRDTLVKATCERCHRVKGKTDMAALVTAKDRLELLRANLDAVWAGLKHPRDKAIATPVAEAMTHTNEALEMVNAAIAWADQTEAVRA